ncbi:MAG TPA: response regulator transcription factor [Anaerolineae bacterium]|nr:response regulator transcription factor [Anaerolineae bacterium]
MDSSGTVLIIDDEPVLRNTLARVLRQAGWEVTTAADGPEALQRLESNTYDLVYLDIRLPGMDGLQVLEAAHRLHPELPVVLFTAHASLQSALEALRLGATDYLIKPIDPEVLIARTRAILTDLAVQRRRREIQEQIDALQLELKALSPASAPTSLPEAAPGDRFIKCGPLILDRQTLRVTFHDRVLALPPSTFDYLSVLVRHAPDIVTYQTLVAEAQGYRADRLQAQELAKWHIHKLREALEPGADRPKHILNVRGMGYRLVVD